MEPLNNKYDALLEDGENGQSILQHYSSIIELKKSEAKINLLISLQETEQQQRQQLKSMKENIESALKEQISTLRQKQKKVNAYPLSIDLLTAQDVGKLAKCFIQQDRKWKNSVVQQVDIEEQTAKIKKYGTNDVLQLPAYLLKVLKEPDPEPFKEGTHCKAIYSGDGQFYPCVIEKITEEGYLVKYKKYNAQEIVKLHRLRPSGNPNQKVQQVKFEHYDEFKVPDKLKILPNDPQNVKKSKKTKLKALKFAFKNAQVQQANKEKQQKWKDWNSGSSSAQKTGYFKTKYDNDVFQHKKP